jgi:hypothetical protein
VTFGGKRHPALLLRLDSSDEKLTAVSLRHPPIADVRRHGEKPVIGKVLPYKTLTA